MGIKGLRVPAIKDFAGMNIISAIVYRNELMKRELDPIKKEKYRIQLSQLKIELDIHMGKRGK